MPLSIEDNIDVIELSERNQTLRRYQVPSIVSKRVLKAADDNKSKKIRFNLNHGNCSSSESSVSRELI